MATDYQWIFINGIIAFGSLLTLTTIVYAIALLFLKLKIFHASFATTIAQCFVMLIAYILPLQLSWVPFLRGGDNVEVPIGRDICEAVSLFAVALFVAFWSRVPKYDSRVFVTLSFASCAMLGATNYLANHYNLILLIGAVVVLGIACAILYEIGPNTESWGPTVMLLVYFCYGLAIALTKAFSWTMFEVFEQSPKRDTSEISYLIMDFLATLLLAFVMFLVAHTNVFGRLYKVTSRVTTTE